MASGIFSSLGESYIKAAGNTFYFTKNSHWLLKPFTLLIAIIYSLVLLPVSLTFLSAHYS